MYKVKQLFFYTFILSLSLLSMTPLRAYANEEGYVTNAESQSQMTVIGDLSPKETVESTEVEEESKKTTQVPIELKEAERSFNNGSLPRTGETIQIYPLLLGGILLSGITVISIKRSNKRTS